MPTSQRFLAPLLLLILAGPLAMIAAAADLGLPSDTLWHWTELSLPFLGIPGGVLVIRGLSIAPKPGQPMDVSRFESKGRSILLAWAFIIGPIALFVAAAISPIVGLFIVSVAVLWVLLWTPPLLRRVQVETSGLIQRDPRYGVFLRRGFSEPAPLRAHCAVGGKTHGGANRPGYPIPQQNAADAGDDRGGDCTDRRLRTQPPHDISCHFQRDFEPRRRHIYS